MPTEGASWIWRVCLYAQTHVQTYTHTYMHTHKCTTTLDEDNYLALMTQRGLYENHFIILWKIICRYYNHYIQNLWPNSLTKYNNHYHVLSTLYVSTRTQGALLPFYHLLLKLIYCDGHVYSCFLDNNAEAQTRRLIIKGARIRISLCWRAKPTPLAAWLYHTIRMF